MAINPRRNFHDVQRAIQIENAEDVSFHESVTSPPVLNFEELLIAVPDSDFTDVGSVAHRGLGEAFVREMHSGIQG